MVSESPVVTQIASTFRVQVLGPFTLERDGVPLETSRWQRRVASLFKLLATAPQCRRLRDDVIDVLWPEAAPEAGAGNLRIVAYRLRLALGIAEPPPVLLEHGWVLLNPAYSWNVDVHRFEELARTAGDDIALLQQALDLYRGEPLLEERYEDWAIPVRDHLQRTWRDLCLRLAAACRVRALFDQAIGAFERVLEDDPLDEEALRGLLTVLYQAGRSTDALRRYQQFEERLAADFGVPPSEETMAVVQQLHAQFKEPSAHLQARVAPARPLPIGRFLGALPDGPLVGRDDELERILLSADAVQQGSGRLVLLGGERGVGKTRLAQEVAVRLDYRGFLVATATCDRAEQATPLAPFFHAVPDAYHRAPPSVRLDADTRWQHLDQLLPGRNGPAPDEQPGTVPLPAADEGEPDKGTHPPQGGLIAGREQGQDLYQRVTSLFTAIAAEKPLALLVDDLHWADAATLDLLLHLARQTRNQRLLLLGTYRDEALDREHPLSQAVRELARDGLVERIPVRRLSLEGTAALVAASVGEMEAAEEFSEFVYRRTKGIPFYIDKLLQALGGRYCLVRPIGQGGMGRVFEALDTKTGEAVAAKIMFARTEADPRALQRFEQEGAVLAQLEHPNIVRVYGTYLEEHANTIVMELVEGQSLGQLLRQDGERLSLPRIKQLAGQVAAALACAHTHGIVHRDIKPDNIMVGAHDQVKVTDFGIARLVRPRGPLTSLTSTGMKVGTPLYMAPEQIEARGIDARTDIYSLGGLLYHLVTGRPPFVGDDSLSVAFKHVHEKPVPPSSINPKVPEDWERLILQALAKDPADRFQTVEEMGAAIAALSEKYRIAVAPVQPAEVADQPLPPPQVEAAPALPVSPVESRPVEPVPA